MKPFPLNAWYAAAYDVEVKAALLGRTICGQKIVMFRQDSRVICFSSSRLWSLRLANFFFPFFNNPVLIFGPARSM